MDSVNMDVVNLREPKMATRVADQLRKMFIRGEVAEGALLPPEAELMTRFGVSRPTLREAFRVLESESLIEVQRGVRGGARFTRPKRETLARYAGLILEYEGVTLKDVFDARATLETPMVIELANRRNKAAIAELERVLELEAGSEGATGVDLRTEFHVALARLSGNRTLQMISEMLYHIIEKANRSLQPTMGPRAENAGRRASKTHRAGLDLIKAGEAEKAAELWNRHLVKSEEYILTGAEISTVVDLLE